MNKLFFTICIAALAAGCLANHDEQEREKETGLLIGHERLFADYCLSERSAIIADIKSRASEQSSIIFEIFFGAATEIADEVMQVERSAVEQFSKEIQTPSEVVSDAPLPEDKIEALIEEGKREIQAKQNVFGRFVAATRTLVGPVLLNTANSAIFVRLAKARSMMNAQTLLKGIMNTCAQVHEYENKLESDLVTFKQEKLVGQDEEVSKFVDSMSVQKLKCYTTKYISRLDAFCSMFKDGARPFMKMLGLNSNFQLPQVGVETTIAPVA